MAVEYRELSTDDDFDQVSDLQRRVFGFSDLDLVAPPMLRLVARKNPPLGVLVGAFLNEGAQARMVGFMMGFATFQEKSIYATLLGVLPEYQEGPYGYRLILKFREVCVGLGLESQYGIFDPLAPNLARLYVGGVGHIGIEYVADRLMYRWDFSSDHTLGKLNRTRAPRGGEVIDTAPQARPGFLPDAPEVLFEIHEESPVHREEIRTVFGEYLNVRHYTVVDCLTTRLGGERRSYYILQKPL